MVHFFESNVLAIFETQNDDQFFSSQKSIMALRNTPKLILQHKLDAMTTNYIYRGC